MRLPWLTFRAVVLVALTAACSAAAPVSTSAPATQPSAVATAALSSPPSPSPTSSVLVLHVLADFVANSKLPGGGSLRWSPNVLSAPADEPFQIAMKVPNETIHNLYIEDTNQTPLFKGGDEAHGTKTYDIPALAAGTYRFVCTYHRNLMTGTLTVK